MMMNNPIFDVPRLECHDDDPQIVKDLIAELNAVYGAIKELAEMQLNNRDIDLMPRLYQLLARGDEILKAFQRLSEQMSDE